MAEVIEFYIPGNFHKRFKWIPAALRGKLIPFRPMPKPVDSKSPRLAMIYRSLMSAPKPYPRVSTSPI